MKPTLLAIVLALSLCVVAHAAAPQVAIPRLATAPAIDGKLDDAAWASAAQVSAFTVAGTGAMATRGGSCLLAYDGRALYLGFRAPSTAAPQAESRTRDGAVWQDDAVEFLLDPGRTQKTFFHFIVNAVGSIYDAKLADTKFTAAMTAAGGRDAQGWTVEVALPFASLGVAAPKVGESWGGTFCLDAQTPTPEISSWADVGARFETPEKFGLLTFGGDTAVQLLPIACPASDEWTVALQAVSRQAADVNVEASVRVGGVVVAQASQTLKPAANQPAALKLPVKLSASGRHTLRVSATAAAQTLYAQETDFDHAGTINLQARNYAAGDQVDLALVLSPEVLSRPDLAVEFSVLNAAGERVGKTVIATQTAGKGGLHVRPQAGVDPVLAGNDALGRKFMLRLPLRGAPGAYMARAELTSGGKAFGEGLARFTVLPTHDYFRSTAGVSDTVQPPFKPLKASGSQFSCWGRKYDFAGGPFPASVQTAGQQVLAGPVRLVGASAGKPLSWRVAGGRGATMVAGVSAAWEGKARAADLSLWTINRVEYDGGVTTALRLEGKPGQTLDRLALEIPLKAANAKYIHAAKNNWADSYSDGIEGPGWKWEKPFYPYVWLGDEERGLAWFSETDEPFLLNDRSKAVQVEHLANGQVVLRLNLIDHPVPLAGPLQWKFGLQATPVKAVPKRLPHLFHGAHFGMETEPWRVSQALSYPAPGNIAMAQGTLEMVATVDFDPAESAANKQNYGLFSMKQANGNTVCWFWDYVGQGLWFYVGLGSGYPQTYPVHISANNLGWKKGETHHIALTWGDKTRMVIDGKLAAESVAYPGWLTDALSGTLLQFGSVGSDPGGFTMHELRISGQAEKPEQLIARAAQVRQDGAKVELPDSAGTLLLDHCAGLAPNQQPLPAAKFSAQGALRGGTLAKPGVMKDGGFALGGGAQEMTLLDFLKSKGVEVLVYHDTWTDQYGLPTTKYGDQLRSLVKGCHDRGLKLIVYFGYGLAGTTEEMKTYHDQWTVWPLIPWSGGRPERTFDAGCNGSPLMEYMCDGIAKLARDFDIDGIYMDGTTESFACVNETHGCGTLRDGKKIPTYPIWRNREFMRRLYTIFHEQRKEPILDQHMSGNMIIPELSFCDSYWDGEQFEGYKFGEQTAQDLMPLDKFRAEFMGKQWGLRAEFLNYEKRPFTMRESLAFVLLHDMYVRASGAGDHLDQVAAIWKAFDDFGTDRATWLPYWKQQAAVPGQPGVYCSAYTRPRQGALLVVSNLGAKPVTATVTLSRKQLGLGKGPVTATEARTGQQFSVQEDTLSVALDSMDYVLVKVGR